MSSTTPVSITLRANEWEDIESLLHFAGRECERIGFITSTYDAHRLADIIGKRVRESK